MLGTAVADLRAVRDHIEVEFGHMRDVIGKILVNHVALVTAADHEIRDPMSTMQFPIKLCELRGRDENSETTISGWVCPSTVAAKSQSATIPSEMRSVQLLVAPVPASVFVTQRFEEPYSILNRHEFCRRCRHLFELVQ